MQMSFKVLLQGLHVAKSFVCIKLVWFPVIIGRQELFFPEA